MAPSVVISVLGNELLSLGHHSESMCRDKDGAHAPLISHFERKCRKLSAAPHSGFRLGCLLNQVGPHNTQQQRTKKKAKQHVITPHPCQAWTIANSFTVWSTPGHTYGGKGLQEHLSKELLLWVQFEAHFSLLPDRDYETLCNFSVIPIHYY